MRHLALAAEVRFFSSGSRRGAKSPRIFDHTCGTVENRISCPATKDRVPHPSRSLRRVGCHCCSPEALPRNFCLSHPSQKTRRMGHPILCGRATNTRLPFDLSLVFITLGEPQAHGTRLNPYPSSESFSAACLAPGVRFFPPLNSLMR